MEAILPQKIQYTHKLCFHICIMYSMQGPKVVVEPNVDQVLIFYRFSIITNKIKSSKALKQNIF